MKPYFFNLFSFDFLMNGLTFLALHRLFKCLQLLLHQQYNLIINQL